MITDNLQMYASEIYKDIESVLDFADNIYASASADGNPCSYAIDGVSANQMTGSFIMSHIYETFDVATIDELMTKHSVEIATFAGTIPSQRANLMKKFFKDGHPFTKHTKDEVTSKLLFLTLAVISIKRAVTLIAMREKHSDAFKPGSSYRELSQASCEFMADMSTVALSIAYPLEVYEDTNRNYFDANSEVQQKAA